MALPGSRRRFLAALAVLAFASAGLVAVERPVDAQLVSATFQVKNTSQTTLNATFLLSSSVPKRSQLFTTGPSSGGHVLGSIGIKFRQVHAFSSAGTELTVTLELVNEDGNPSGVLCTLTNPASFISSGTNYFEVPTTGTMCPTLSASTTYAVVIGRQNSNTQPISLAATASVSQDDGFTSGWGISDDRLESNGSVWTSSLNQPHQIDVRSANVAATGDLVISGTAQVGRTLMADTSGIVDADGLTRAVFRYRWVRTSGSSDTDIARSSSASYTLGADDKGSTIKVEVTFTDDHGYEESLTSAASANVSGPAVPGSRRVTDISLHSDNGDPAGVWGDAATIWVANNAAGTTTSDKIFAYRRSNGSRDAGKDFDGLIGAGNATPSGICSDGTTMFVADSANRQIYAYKMSDRSRDADKDISLLASNADASGLWCDANTVWVSNDGGGSSSKIYAYKRSDGSRDLSKEFDDLHLTGFMFAMNNSDPRGLWSNGETMFAVDREDATVYAYAFSDGAEDLSLRLALDPDNADAHGMWFDGRVLWVSDSDDDVLYAYDLPGARTSRRIWSGTAVVTGHMSPHLSPNSLIGYDADAVEYPFSSLDDDDFDYGSTTYTINELRISDPPGPAQNILRSRLMPAATESVWNKWELVLDAAGVAYSFAGDTSVDENADRFESSWTTPLGFSGSQPVEIVLQAVPAAAAGAPEVTGIARVGNKLTADVSAITDANGLSEVNYAYQWVRVDDTDESDIAGATEASYSLTDSDIDKQLKVRVVFNDDASFEEYPLTSAASEAIGPRPQTAASATQVKNTGHTRSGAQPQTDYSWHAMQAFTTGPNPYGYKLDSVGFYLNFDPITFQVLRARNEATLYEMGDNDLPGDALCTLTDPSLFPDSGIATFTTPTSGNNRCPTLEANTTYAAGVSLADSSSNLGSNVSYTSASDEDTLNPPTGWTIADQRFIYRSNFDHWTVQNNSSYVIEVDAAPNIGPLVSNTDQSVDGAANTLDTGNPKRAQGFETSDDPGGYGLGSVGINFAEIHADSQPASELTVTLNADGTNPGSALCTLTNPTSFDPSGVQFFEAPTTGDGACPPLAASTSYFVVIERANNTTDAISLTKTDSNDEDPVNPATGWTVANTRRHLSSGTWMSQSTAHMIEVHGTVLAEQVNSDPMGVPTITGTPTVGKELTADTSAISDANGLDNVDFMYQWIRTSNGSDADIPGATSQTYTLAPADEGNTVKVRVTFTDNGGTQESLVSAATDAIAAETAITLVKNTGQSASGDIRALNSGTTARAQVFTTGSSSDGYVLDSIGIKFEEIAAGSDAGNELTVTLQSVDTADNNDPAGELCTLTNPSDITAAGTHYFAAPTGDSGTCPKLSARTIYAVAVARANNNTNTITLEETSADAEDTGAADGWTISGNRHRYVGTNWVRNSGGSHMIDVKGHVNADATGAPTVTGTPRVGQVLTADTSGITDTNGLTGVEYSYRWIRVDGGTDADIASATNPTYTLGPNDGGKSVKVKVSFTDDVGFDESLTSAAVAVMAQNTAPTGAPTISGTPTVGQTLIALTSGIDDADGLTTAEFEFRWIRTSGRTDTDIAHASSQSYTLGAQDEGSTIKVRVSFTDDADNSESLTSAATAEVSGAAVPGSQRSADISLSGMGWPTGVWGNAETIWVANNSSVCVGQDLRVSPQRRQP